MATTEIQPYVFESDPEVESGRNEQPPQQRLPKVTLLL